MNTFGNKKHGREYIRKEYELINDFYFINSVFRGIASHNMNSANLLIEHILEDEDNILKGHSNIIMESLNILI